MWTREGNRRGGETALEAHLGTAGSPQQRTLATPVDWKVEWTAYRNVDAKEGKLDILPYYVAV